MATPVSPPVIDEHLLYPSHEEDEVPEKGLHEKVTRYVRDAISARFRDRNVFGNVCIYWEPGNFALYRAPDVCVTEGPRREPPYPTYLVWSDPRVVFVGEIGSRSTFRADEGPKLEIYAAHIHPEEYFYAHVIEDEQKMAPEGLKLWRRAPPGYQEVAPQPNGRLRSRALDLEFGVDEHGYLRLYALDGEPLPTYEESEDVRQKAERDLAASEEARREAEERAREAERRAAAEEAARNEFARRVAELEAELKRRGPAGA